MELLSMYLFNALSIQTTGLSMQILSTLKNLDWFNNDAGNMGRFRVMNKRYDINGTLYRVMIRFQVTGSGLVNLDMPVPFLVAQMEQDRSVATSREISLRFKDVKAWHGREMINTAGFVKAGVPIQLIDAVQEDLKLAMDPKFDSARMGGIKFDSLDYQSTDRVARAMNGVQMLNGLTADILVDTVNVRVLGIDLDQTQRRLNNDR